jgi:hypothetical protein
MNNPNIPLPNRTTVLANTNLNTSKRLLQQRITILRGLIHNQFHGAYGGLPMPARPRWLESQENKIDRAEKLIAEINKAMNLRRATSNRWAGAPTPRRHFNPNTLRKIEQLENHAAFNIPAWHKYYNYKKSLGKKLKVSVSNVEKFIKENKLTRNRLAHYYIHEWMMKIKKKSLKRKYNNT